MILFLNTHSDLEFIIYGARLFQTDLASFISEGKLNWNLEILVFQEGGRPEYPRKTLTTRTRNNNKLNTGLESNPGHIGGRRSHHCTIPALQK